jgi:hypothetical protein
VPQAAVLALHPAHVPLKLPELAVIYLVDVSVEALDVNIEILLTLTEDT